MTYTIRPSIPGIRTSRGVYPRRTPVRPSPFNAHPVCYGDRLYVSLRFADGSGMKIYTDRASDMTELIGEVRLASWNRRGLVRMCVRNATRGWIVEKPLMLYGEMQETEKPGSVFLHSGY